MKEPTLFTIAEVSPVPSGLTCNTCIYRQRWQCNSKIVQYCSVRQSKQTENGLLKIKCKTVACLQYKPAAVGIDKPNIK